MVNEDVIAINEKVSNVLSKGILGGLAVGAVGSVAIPGIRCKMVTKAKRIKENLQTQKPFGFTDIKGLGDLRRSVTRLNDELLEVDRNFLSELEQLQKSLKKAKDPESQESIKAAIKELEINYKADDRVNFRDSIIEHDGIKTIAMEPFQEQVTKLLMMVEEGKVPLGKGSKVGDFDRQVAELLGEELEADKLIGLNPKGGKSLTYREIIEETGSSGIAGLDSLVEKYGMESLDFLEGLSKTFREGALLVGLEPERFLKNYFPRFQSKVTDILKQMAAEGTDVAEVTKISKITEAFFKKQRTSQKPGEEVSILEAVLRYQHAVRKSLDRQLYVKAADVLSGDPEMKTTVGRAARQLMDNISDMRERTIADNIVDSFRNNFYGAVLSNNPSSTMNNMTQLLNITGTEFGYSAVADGIAEVMKGESSLFKPLLDSMGIKPERALSGALDLLDLEGRHSIEVIDRAKDMFAQSEAFMQSVTAVAAIKKRFKGREKEFKELLERGNLDELTDVIGTARKAIMKTMFTNIDLNRSWIDNNSLARAPFTFLNHSFRETRFVTELFRDVATGKGQSRVKATGKMLRYLTSKTMIMGGQMPWLFIPATVRNYMEENHPHVSQSLVETQIMLDAVPSLKTAMAVGHLDLTTRQGLFDFFTPIASALQGKISFDQAARQIPIVEEGKRLLRTGAQAVDDKDDPRDLIKLGGALLAYGGSFGFPPINFKVGGLRVKSVGGTLSINGYPIGATTVKNMGVAMVDLAEERTTFWGHEKSLETTDDKVEAIVSNFFSTPREAGIIRKMTGEANAGAFAGLTLKGVYDQKMYALIVEESYQGNKKKAADAMIRKNYTMRKKLDIKLSKGQVKRINKRIKQL